jgi:pimeloyl-ACP methyl ester carboxylesterase
MSRALRRRGTSRATPGSSAGWRRWRGSSCSTSAATGLSDPALDFPTTRERSEDLFAVLDAARSRRAVLFGVCGGRALCIQLAADHPDRVGGLVLHNAMARMLRAEDYPWGWEPEQYDRLLAGFEDAWLGRGEGLVAATRG